MPAARAGRGVEIVIGLGEDAEVAARRLLARTTAPLVTEVEVSGSALIAVAPEHPMDLFGGAPALLCLKLSPAGGELVVRGKMAEGNYLERLTIQPMQRGEGSAAIGALFARECVEDLETRAAAGGHRGEIDRQVEQLGLSFQISTRLTSWVAVSKKQTVDPTAPSRNEVVPQNLPFGMSAEGLGLRGGVSAPPALGMVAGGVPAPAPSGAPMMRMRKSSVSRSSGGSPPPPAKSVIDRIRDFASDAFGSADEDAGALEEVAEPEAEGSGERSEEGAAPASPPQDMPKREEARREPGQPARRFTARMVVLTNGRMVLKFIVDGGALIWAPTQVSIELADGTFVTVEIDTTRTTTSGTIQDGLTVSLALNLPAAAMGQPAKIHLKSGTVPLLLEL